VFDGPQKRRMIEDLTEAMVAWSFPPGGRRAD
jgi:hypothetical protein